MRIQEYPIDDNISINDIVIGSDGDDLLRTKNFSVMGLVNLVRELGGLGGIEYTFSDGTTPALTELVAGYMTTNGNETSPASINTINLNDVNLGDEDLSELFTLILNNPSSFRLKLINSGDSNDIFYFDISSVSDETYFYEFSVTPIGSLYNGELADTISYSIFLELKGSEATGLEALNEGNGIGWRLIGRDPARYGNIGLNAVDFSVSLSASSTRGATGELSVVSGGFTNIASGYNSTIAGGNSNTASGYASVISGGSSHVASDLYSTVSGGLNNDATEQASTVVGGQNNIASGRFSTVLGGTNNTSYSFVEIVGGSFPTTYTPASTTSFNAADRLFNIGNGTGTGTRSDAFTVYKSGLVEAPDLTTGLIDAGSEKTLITKEYLTSHFMEIDDFTPALEDVGGGATYTYTIQRADYIKMGRFVHINIQFVEINTTGTPTGELRVTGLPFATRTVSSVEPVLVTTFSGGDVPFYSIHGTVFQLGADVQISLGVIDTLGTSTINPLVDVTISAGGLYLSVSYITED